MDLVVKKTVVGVLLLESFCFKLYRFATLVENETTKTSTVFCEKQFCFCCCGHCDLLRMECSIPQAFPNKAATSDKNLQPGQSPPKSVLHVNFDLDSEEVTERKKKYLTAKYGQHQMSLIKKRLRVEMWMYDQLQALYESSDDGDNYEVEIDLDELLDIEAESARKEWLRKKLVGAKKPASQVELFITELLQRAATL